MKCRQCGRELPEGVQFCSQCGTQVESEPGKWSNRLPEQEQIEQEQARQERGCQEYPDKKEKKEWKDKYTIVILMAAMAVAVIVGVVIRNQLKTGEKREDARTEQLEELSVEESNSDEQGVEKSEKIKDTDKKTQYDIQEYVIKDSSIRYLSDADIYGLSLQEINYAKNEIYARHGRRFKSTELNRYFEGKSWYEGKYDPDDFDANYSDSLLNDFEKKNAEFLSNAEFSLDSKGYQLDSQ